MRIGELVKILSDMKSAHGDINILVEDPHLGGLHDPVEVEYDFDRVPYVAIRTDDKAHPM